MGEEDSGAAAWGGGEKSSGLRDIEGPRGEAASLCFHDGQDGRVGRVGLGFRSDLALPSLRLSDGDHANTCACSLLQVYQIDDTEVSANHWFLVASQCCSLKSSSFPRVSSTKSSTMLKQF